jgi:GGDEF domain-containing protein
VAFAPDHGLRPSDVLRRADAALYRVKKRRHADPVAAESVPLNNGVDHDRV